jgi:hypothetical protein
MAEKTPAKINEAQQILDLAKKARPGPATGPSAPPKAPAGAPSPKR